VTAPAGHALARRAIDIAFIGLIGLALLIVLVGRIVPMTGHPTLVVAGGSMGASFGVGSAIILDRVDPATLVAGDVVSLRSGPAQAVYTHRIVRTVERDGQPWLETKGDANPAADPSITPASAVIGRVALVLPLVGFLIAFLSAPTGILAVMAMGGALLLARSMVGPTPVVREAAGRSRYRVAARA